MKIGLYFGSFNPIHTGHLIIASSIAECTDLDSIWFVLSPQNPLKKMSTLLNKYERLQLVQLAIEDDARFKWSDIEFKLKKPSYTIDTLQYLHEKYSQHLFCVIMGSDSFTNIKNWKNYEVILNNYQLYIYNRPNFPVIENIEAQITVLDAPLLEISSTYIRATIKAGKSIKYLVPEKVRLEIENNGYYLR